jgi:hypothetical protein
MTVCVASTVRITMRVNPKLYKKTVVETLGDEMYGGGGGRLGCEIFVEPPLYRKS